MYKIDIPVRANQCTIEKSTLSCTHCNSTSSHNTAACRKKDGVKKQKSPLSSPHRDRSQSPAGGKRSPTPAAAALKSNSATIKHTLNRVSVKFRQMEVKNQSFKVNSSLSSANGSLRTMIAKMSSARTGKTSKERITLNTGMTCSITKLSIAKKLHLDIHPAPGVTITGAGGEDLKVAGQTDVFFSVFNNSPMRLHLFFCDNIKEDVFISADHLEALGLIPQQWPECMNPCHKQYSNNYTAATAAAAATEEEPKEEEDSGVAGMTVLYFEVIINIIIYKVFIIAGVGLGNCSVGGGMEEEEEEGEKVLVNSGKFNLYLCIIYRLSGPGVGFK